MICPARRGRRTRSRSLPISGRTGGKVASPRWMKARQSSGVATTPMTLESVAENRAAGWFPPQLPVNTVEEET